MMTAIVKVADRILTRSCCSCARSSPTNVVGINVELKFDELRGTVCVLAS